MTTTTAPDLGIALVAAFNNRNFDTWSASFSDDFIADYPGHSHSVDGAVSDPHDEVER